MSMSDAYRWSKEMRPIDLGGGSVEYTQLTDVFDLFVFDFAESLPEQAVEHLEVCGTSFAVAWQLFNASMAWSVALTWLRRVAFIGANLA